LVDDAGKFRSGSVGIFQGKKLIHMAPSADRVHFLMDDLFSWLKKTPVHPIVASCMFHYEFEFIHPFSDGNGRLGRLWQTLILSKWKPLWAYLPFETIIAEKQCQYYSQLGKSDAKGNSTLGSLNDSQAIHDVQCRPTKRHSVPSTTMAPISAKPKLTWSRAQLGAQSKPQFPNIASHIENFLHFFK
jgi:hypothetical protein